MGGFEAWRTSLRYGCQARGLDCRFEAQMVDLKPTGVIRGQVGRFEVCRADLRSGGQIRGQKAGFEAWTKLRSGMANLRAWGAKIGPETVVR